LLSFSKVFVYS